MHTSCPYLDDSCVFLNFLESELNYHLALVFLKAFYLGNVLVAKILWLIIQCFSGTCRSLDSKADSEKLQFFLSPFENLADGCLEPI